VDTLVLSLRSPEWHLETIARIQSDGILITALGRERRFWGRPDDRLQHIEKPLHSAPRA
jgi:hypothetical protein